MTEPLFLKSKELYEDISYLNKVIKDHEEKKHWLNVVSARHNSEFEGVSANTQKKLAKLVKNLIAELEKEFEELN